MVLEEMIEYINKSLSRDRLRLSKIGEDAIKDRWKKKEDQGGYSNYWKEVSLEDALKRRK